MEYKYLRPGETILKDDQILDYYAGKYIPVGVYEIGQRMINGTHLRRLVEADKVITVEPCPHDALGGKTYGCRCNLPDSMTCVFEDKELEIVNKYK